MLLIKYSSMMVVACRGRRCLFSCLLIEQYDQWENKDYAEYPLQNYHYVDDYDDKEKAEYPLQNYHYVDDYDDNDDINKNNDEQKQCQ